MTVKVSTGLRNHLLDTGSLRAALANGLLRIYSGTVPASADASLGAATLLRTISLNGTGSGINFSVAAANGVISKAVETWSGLTGPAGTPTFYRHVLSTDTGTTSTTEIRLQGVCGTTGADLNLPGTPWTLNGAVTIDSYTITLPTA